jgi:hypothetical protein
MSQPQWRMIANLGDVNPLDHGGCFIYGAECTVMVSDKGEYLAVMSHTVPSC